MIKTLPFFMMLLLTGVSVRAFELDIISLRTTLSKPETSHTLIHRSPELLPQKSVFLLEPTNNERLGFFLDVNGVEIGYAVDVYNNDIETKTQNILLSYRKLKQSRITLNYQKLEGLKTRADNLTGEGNENQFVGQTTSTKIELFGQHNLYTFGKGESLFEHFFLNKPLHSHQFDWSLSIVGGWSIKYVSLENPQSIVFDTSFVDQPFPKVSKLNSSSFNFDVGPFLSVKLPHNMHFFAEYKLGHGYIRNNSGNNVLKESGDEKTSAIGAGLSWTSHNKKWLLLARGWKQNGRHIDTSFGDISLVRFF